MIRIDTVSSKVQIAALARLAREIWEEHYVPIIGQEQVDYMLERFQSESAIAEQLAGSYEYYVASSEEHSVGYTAVVPDTDKTSMMLSKIYVKKSERGRGLGRKMLEFVEDLCRRRHITKLWLTVNKHNSRSIAWYLRMGFTNAGPTVQDIGGGFVMDDFLMEKELAPD